MSPAVRIARPGEFAAARPAAPMTAVVRDRGRATYVAPTSDPLGRTRRERWGATSVDGVWRYDREPDLSGTPWTVTYRPTGQMREWYGSLDAARRDTANGLLAELRGEAEWAAFECTDSAARAAAQWQLGVHLRLAGVLPEHRCECGGMLATVGKGKQARYAHVDACGECWPFEHPHIADPCPVGGHLVCPTPDAAVCGHQPDNRCAELAVPDGGRSCGAAGGAECCGGCCWPRH